MTNHPGFGVLLTRLLRHRRLGVAQLCAASGIAETELLPVMSGAAPSASLLGALAPVLGLHTADLYVIAGLPVPAALAPRDPAAGTAGVELVCITMALPTARRTRIHRLVEQAGRAARAPRDDHGSGSTTARTPGPASGCPSGHDSGYASDRASGYASGRTSAQPSPHRRNPESLSAMAVDLLCGNRNLRSPRAAVTALAYLTRSRVGLSPSTIHHLGRGWAPLSPYQLAGFAAVLGIAPGDLAALTGGELPEPPWPDDPVVHEMARLLWNCRYLTAAQAEAALREAESMLVAVPEDADEDDWNRVRRRDETWWGAPCERLP